jgi:hypothetical protein
MDHKSFVAEGLRWIASLFEVTAEFFDRHSDYVPYEESISDVRHRVDNRNY